MKFNLILSSSRNREGDAVDEFIKLIEENLEESPIVEISNIQGIIIAFTETDPLEVIDLLKKMASEEPWHFRYILRVIPVQIVCSTNLTEIIDSSCKLFREVSRVSSFKIVVEKRHCNIRSREIVLAIASRITNKVDLYYPDWIILVEILGKRTGISVLRSEHLLSIVKQKMGGHISK
jgi:tRNA acetyltransferase TAN1